MLEYKCRLFISVLTACNSLGDESISPLFTKHKRGPDKHLHLAHSPSSCGQITSTSLCWGTMIIGWLNIRIRNVCAGPQKKSPAPPRKKQILTCPAKTCGAKLIQNSEVNYKTFSEKKIVPLMNIDYECNTLVLPNTFSPSGFSPLPR